MSGHQNGQRERVGFPQAPVNAPYQPSAQFNQFAPPPPSAFPTPAALNGYAPPSAAVPPYGAPMKSFPSGSSFGPPLPAPVAGNTAYKNPAHQPFNAAPPGQPPMPAFPVPTPTPSMPHAAQPTQLSQSFANMNVTGPMPGIPHATASFPAPAPGPPVPSQSRPRAPDPPMGVQQPNYNQPYPASYPAMPSTTAGAPMHGYGAPQPAGGPYNGVPGGFPPGPGFAGGNRPLSDYIDLASERTPMMAGLEEPTYSLPGGGGMPGTEVRCDPAIFRSTLNVVPQSEEHLSKCRLPLGLTLQPFRDVKSLNIIRASTIVRCRYCRTYINPFVSLPDSRRWKCNLCYKCNDLPEDFCYDSSSRSFTEPTNRPEMQQATVEFIAPSEYMLRPPQPAVYLFILDVSTPAIQSGYLATLCEQFIISLDQMPGDDRTLMAFLAVDSALHFFQFHTPGKLPREMVVDDVDEVFLPSNTGLLVKVRSYKESIRMLLEKLPYIFSAPSCTSSANCLGSALEVAKQMISELGGRVSIFQCCLPTVGVGALKAREDPNQRAGGEGDVTPATDFYKRLALDCTAVQMGMDLFAMGTEYMDLATLSEMSKFSSGNVYRFPAFHAVDNSVERRRFEKVVTRYLTRKVGFEAVLRIRCSRGLAISAFFGNFFVRSTDLLSLANVNPDSAVGVQLSYEEKITTPTVCFQAALLYTSSKGDRRIRVHTLCLPTTTELSTLFANVDIRATVSLLAKMGADRAFQGSSLADCREAVVNSSVDGLGAFAKTAGRTGLLAPRQGQLKFLPLMSLALLKHCAFAAGRSIKLDSRVAAMNTLRNASMEYLFTDIYPLLYRLNDLPSMGAADPPALPLSWEHIARDGVYLMIAGHNVFIYVAASSEASFVQSLFGCNYHQLDQNSFREQTNAVSERVHVFVSSLIQRLQIFNVATVVREDSPLRESFVSRMVDDRSESSHSYVEFVNHVKKEIGH